MKINKLMLGLLAGAMFASCSDDLSNEPAGASDPNAIGAEGYIGISIGMPAEPITRGLNDQFEDGLATEYGVTNAVLLFFTGPESNPDFYKAYSIGQGEWNPVNDAPNQITQNRIVTFPVDFAKQSSGQLWVLAVINPGGVLSVGSGNTLNVAGEPFTGTFQEFMALETTNAMIGENNFLMTNAPYASQPGTLAAGAAAPANPRFRVLSLVNQDRIRPTAEEAMERPAAAIFVERAVAKVEVNSASIRIEEGAINFPDESYELNITDTRWALDNMEPTSYIVRNLDFGHDNTGVPYWALYDTNSKASSLQYHYRFLGNAGFGHTNWENTPDNQEHYRTYFCVDPHGNGIEEEDGNLVAAKEGDFTRTGSQYPQYCKENTFDVAHMDYRNTTRAIIKVNFGGNGNIYTVGDDKKNVYFFKDAAPYLAQAVLYDPRVMAAWTAYFDGLNESYDNNATINTLKYERDNRTAENEWMKITFQVNETAGRLQVKEIVLKDGNGENAKAIPFTESAATAAEVNENVTVKCYVDGTAYYAVRIRHFGNDLTPWTAPEGVTTNTTTDSYGKTNGAIGTQDIQNYLGRYGVVRNNWYVLNLGDIRQMGEPVPGDLPLDGTPDDRVQQQESISCRINILSWAKRNQTDNL